MPITPITRKIKKKTTAITRIGIPHLWSHSAWVLNLASVIAITGGCELCGDSGRRSSSFRVAVAWSCRTFRLASDRLFCRLKSAPECLLYTSDAADEEDSVDLGGRR